VVKDPGPARDPHRIIELARTEPQRADQRVRVRRDRAGSAAVKGAAAHLADMIGAEAFLGLMGVKRGPSDPA
jgi:hypothetical protein